MMRQVAVAKVLHRKSRKGSYSRFPGQSGAVNRNSTRGLLRVQSWHAGQTAEKDGQVGAGLISSRPASSDPACAGLAAATVARCQ